MRFRIVTALTIAFAGILASASGDTNYVVQLKNGTTLKGQLLERLPGDHITLKLPSGEKKRFAWADVDSIEEAPAGSGSTSASSSAAPTATESAQPDASASASAAPSASV